jgi:hypothetical protein
MRTTTTRAAERTGGMRAWVILAGLVAVLAACAPRLSPEQCQAGDWRAIGQADGMEGKGLAAFQSHVDSCRKAGVLPDRAAWMAGRAEGLVLYCTPSLAYTRGRRGLSFPEVCEALDVADMPAAWAFGRRYWDLGLEIERIRTNYRSDARDGQLLPSEVALTPAELTRLRQERLRHAYWPPR